MNPADNEGIEARLREEFALLLAQLHIPVICQLIETYGTHMVFRNIAFYRYPSYVPVSARLKDLGYELIPKMPDEYHELGNIPMMILSVTLILSSLTSLFGNEKGKVKPHATNILIRYYIIYTIGHIIRFTMFVGTTLPGSADHCLGSRPGMVSTQPTTMFEIFTR